MCIRDSYYVWVRALGRLSRSNTLHVGINGTWPRNELIRRGPMTHLLTDGWSQNRFPAQNGNDRVSRRDANVWLDIDAPGVYSIEFAMREDGANFDKFILTLDPDFMPDGFGPDETVEPP